MEAGEHRIVSLKCGHIFGEKCIKKWVNEEKKCPTCKSKSSTRDFRNIYATKILIVDNSREAELELEIQKHIAEKIELKAEIVDYKRTQSNLLRQIRELREEIKRLQNIKASAKSLDNSINCVQTIKGGKMYLEKNIDFRESCESKLIAYMTRSKKILITQKTAGTSLFSGYGIRFVDATQYRPEQFINTGARQINDFSFNLTESLITSVSQETSCKIYNINTRQSVHSFSPSQSPLWSCAFNKCRENQVIFGAQNGFTYIYDMKMPNTVLHTIEHNERLPVKQIIPITMNEIFPDGGLLIILIKKVYFYEYKYGELQETRLNFEDSIRAASYDEKTEMIMITSGDMIQPYHILLRLIKVENIPVLQEVYRIQAVFAAKNFSRPTQIKVPDGFILACYAHTTNELQIHTPSIGKIHSLHPINYINDICPLYTDPGNITFAALASTKCRIYKVNLDYR